ncbi:MAG TPA: TolC family protein [Opitutaceae bacterium]|nr:TolC family protein [Opitutaceae bacterium]
MWPALAAQEPPPPAAGPAPANPTEVALAPRRLERLTLEDAIRRALEKNYVIRIAGLDAASTAADVTTALGKFDPVLNASYTKRETEDPQLADPLTGIRPPATLNESDEYELTLNGLMPWGLTYSLGASTTNSRGTFNLFSDHYSTFAGVSGRQPLLRDFGFGPTLASIRIAQTNRSISDWQFRQSVIDTVTRVIFAYNELNLAKGSLRSSLRTRELAAQLLAQNEIRFRVGDSSEADVTTARARLAVREESILANERRVRDAENFLKQLISDERAPSVLDFGFDIEPPAAPPAIVADAATDFHIALEKRPDYQQAKLALKRAEIGHRLARNQLLPSVDLIGSYGYAGEDRDFYTSRRIVRAEDNRAYSYGVAVSIPLTSAAERGRYRAAKLDRRQAELNLERIEQDIVIRLGNAAGQIETARKRVETTRYARELAQLTLDAEEKKLRAGQGTTFFVSNEQSNLNQAELAELRAQTDYLNALATYDQQMGLTLEKLGIGIEPPR